LTCRRALAPKYFSGCSVLTCEGTPETVKYPHYQTNELKLLQEGRLARFEVVAFDRDYYAQAVDAALERVLQVDITCSPFFVLVDSRGNCRRLGWIYDVAVGVELWNAVGEAYHADLERASPSAQQTSTTTTTTAVPPTATANLV